MRAYKQFSVALDAPVLMSPVFLTAWWPGQKVVTSCQGCGGNHFGQTCESSPVVEPQGIYVMPKVGAKVPGMVYAGLVGEVSCKGDVKRHDRYLIVEQAELVSILGAACATCRRIVPVARSLWHFRSRDVDYRATVLAFCSERCHEISRPPGEECYVIPYQESGVARTLKQLRRPL